MALAYIVVLCLLVYRLAEVRERLVAMADTVPDQLRRPTARPTMRWLFQCFDGIDPHHMTCPDGARTTEVLRLSARHRSILRLLGPAYQETYFATGYTAECAVCQLTRRASRVAQMAQSDACSVDCSGLLALGTTRRPALPRPRAPGGDNEERTPLTNLMILD